MKIVLFTICLSILLAVTLQAQTNFFTPNEIDSMNYFYSPLYSSDSVKVSDIKGFYFLNVFFFNGECSLCLATMKTVEDFFLINSCESVKTLFVAQTNDTIILNFYRDKYNIKTPIVWDNKHRVRDKKITNEDSRCFLIDKRGNIILSGDFLTDTAIREKYIRWMNNHRLN